MSGKDDKLAVGIIVKGTDNDPVNLRRALESVKKWVDEIFVTITGPRSQVEKTEKVCKEFGVTVSYGDFNKKMDEETVKWLKEFFGYDPHMKVGDHIFLFDEARNYNLSQIPKEYKWMMWMDSDDVLKDGENLWKIKEIGEQANIEAFYLNYLYEIEMQGEFCECCGASVEPSKRQINHVIIEHIRERIIRNEGKFKWIAPIHETLIEQVPTRKTDNYDCSIIHLATREARANSLTRNLNNLEYAIYKSEGKDPRHIYYLAKALFDFHTMEYFDKAIPLINAYLHGEHKSGWPEERGQAWGYLSEIYRQKAQFNNAIKASLNALVEAPENPIIFLDLSVSYMMKKDWERSLFWARLASNVKDKKSTLVHNPQDLQRTMLEVLYTCHLNMGHVDEAWAAIEKMMEVAPENPSVKEAHQFMTNLREQRDITKSVYRLAEYLKKTGEWFKIKPLLQATPKIAEETPFIIELNQKNNPPTYWGKKDITIYCGPGFTQWSPKALEQKDARFVGGSEEAVIYAARELQKIGWKVTVYADPGNDEGVHDGVTYLPYYKFNRLDSFNILIVWRNIGFFDQELKFKKSYVWLHDIQNPLDWTPERWNKVTKVMFLSQWHRDTVKNLPEEKVLLTSNGI